MKTRSRRNRSLNISNSRWIAYAVAGLATASGGAVSAEAAIHYSGLLNIKLKRYNDTVRLPLSSGGVFSIDRTSTFAGTADVVFVLAPVSAGVLDKYVSYSELVRKLPRGVNVSTASGSFRNAGWLDNPSNNGYFTQKGRGFALFRFNAGRGPQYGWVRIRTLQGGNDPALVVVDYAWGDPGEPILTGQKSERAAPKPESITTSGSLGLLAFGAAGLLAWRKVRRQMSV